ncbi:MAG: hypothetical protein WEB87_00600, partial [Bacteriovoracaceae bacterium]
PNIKANTCSRTNPKIRLQKVATAIFIEESNNALEFAKYLPFSKMLKQSRRHVNNIKRLAVKGRKRKNEKDQEEKFCAQSEG